MNKIIGFLVIFVFLILQIAFIPHLSVRGIYPDIVLVIILVFAVMQSGRWVFIFAFVAGLAMDIFSSRAFGIYTLSFVILTWLIQYIGKNIFKATDFSGQFSILALACALASILNLFLIKNFYWLGLGQNIAFWNDLLKIGLIEILFNFVIAIFGLMIFKKIHGISASI